MLPIKIVFPLPLTPRKTTSCGRVFAIKNQSFFPSQVCAQIPYTIVNCSPFHQNWDFRFPNYPPLQLLPTSDMLVLLSLILGGIEIRSKLGILPIMGIVLLAGARCIFHPALDARLRTERARYERWWVT